MKFGLYIVGWTQKKVYCTKSLIASLQSLLYISLSEKNF